MVMRQELKKTYFCYMLVKTYGSAVFGVNAHKITIEVNIGSGQVKYFMVGLPDNAVKESQLRIETALKITGLECQGRGL